MSLALGDLLARERHGVLATLSSGRQGWPFASLVQYAQTETSEPLLLLSDLAEHTRNLRDDPRASLLVQDSAARQDPQAGARATLLGVVEVVATDAEMAAGRACFVRRHPRSEEYFSLGDFRLYVLRPREARLIGGFGDMGWLAGERLQAAMRATPSPDARPDSP